ncbi:MAG: ABC transporter permease [Sciscionella sp.]
MTTHTLVPARGGLTGIFRDGGMITWRNLINIRRNPDMLLASTVQPIMFVLLFAYVFGGSIGNDPAAYREFLMGGIFTQTVAFNSAFTTIGLANDLHKGIIDRFRALPMSRLAVILGRTSSDLVVSVLGLVVMSLCGLLVGWRIHGSVGAAIGAYLLLLLFAFAMSWVGALIGLAARSVEVAQSAGLIWLFPVTFVSSAFVSADRMPGPLKAIAHWNPITALANATRKLFGNATPPGFPHPSGWPVDHAVLYSALCSIAIIAIFLPLAVARYRRVASH